MIPEGPLAPTRLPQLPEDLSGKSVLDTRVEPGLLTAAVSTNGTLASVVAFLVGSQVPGHIRQLFADFNSAVRKNPVIAQIDSETLEAKVNQAHAEVDSAKATLLNQQTQVDRARAAVENARASTTRRRPRTMRPSPCSMRRWPRSSRSPLPSYRLRRNGASPKRC